MKTEPLNEIKSEYIQIGMRFSAPLFFDDGENMFLAEGKTVKKYHIDALKRWDIKRLVTYGHIIVADANAPEEWGGLEELEELDDLDELEEL